MSPLQISFACAAYDRMVPLLAGEVRPAGIDLNFIPIANPRDTFDRMAGKIEQMEAEADAAVEIHEEYSGDQLAAKFNKLEASSGSDMDLADLKSKMGLAPPAAAPAPAAQAPAAPVRVAAQKEAPGTPSQAEQDELAAVTGKSQSTISKWRSGTHEPSKTAWDRLMRFAKADPRTEHLAHDYVTELLGKDADQLLALLNAVGAALKKKSTLERT